MQPGKVTILAPCLKPINPVQLVTCALPVAKVFNATLTFLINEKSQNMTQIQSYISTHFSTSSVENTFRFLSLSSATNPYIIAEKNSMEEDIIMVIFHAMPSGHFSHFRQLQFLLRTKKLRLPYLVLPPSVQDNWIPEKILLPIGYDLTDKEPAIWASYFARFNNSKIILIKALEKENWAINNINSNIHFIKKLFKETDVNFDIINTTNNSQKIYTTPLKSTELSTNSLIMISTTKHYSVEHYFSGPNEQKILNNKENIPVLCINPVKNTLVLCK